MTERPCYDSAISGTALLNRLERTAHFVENFLLGLDLALLRLDHLFQRFDPVGLALRQGGTGNGYCDKRCRYRLQGLTHIHTNHYQCYRRGVTRYERTLKDKKNPAKKQITTQEFRDIGIDA